MDSLETLFISLMDKELTFPKLMAKLVSHKLVQVGIKLDREELQQLWKTIEDQLTNVEKDGTESLTIDLSLKDTNSAISQDVILNALNSISAGDIHKFEEFLPQMTETLWREMANSHKESLISSWKESATTVLEEERQEAKEFQSIVNDVWGKPLQLLEMFISLCRFAAEEFDKTYLMKPETRNDYVFEALRKLFARGCQVSAEILLLLKSGFADGAHARWRTLHEISVTAAFINKHGSDVAERYLFHHVVEHCKTVEQNKEHFKTLGFDPIPEDELKEISERRDFLVKRFGDRYKSDYGWAATVLNDLTFKAIEADIAFDHLRFYFKMANNNVHAGSSGIEYRLGLPYKKLNLLPSGGSVYGLDYPGQNTAFSLRLLTATLLMSKLNLDSYAFVQALMIIFDEVFSAFTEAAETQAAQES